MSKVFDSLEQEIFETFLIKEREQREIEKNHAQQTVMYWSRCLKEEEEKATIFTKIKWFIKDIIDGHKLHQIKNYNEKRIIGIPKEDLCNKDLQHKVITKKDFNLHFYLNQIFDERTTIADCGGIHYPYLCYKVFMQIEYSELLTEKHYEKEFEQIDEALNYFNNLIKEYKNKSVENIISKITNEIDEHCDELKERIEFFKNN